MANRDGKGDVARTPHPPQPPVQGLDAPVPPPHSAPPIPSGPSASPPRLLATRQADRLNDAELRRRFGRNVRTERDRRALSQIDLSFRSKIHRSHISLIESGRRDVQLTTICALAAALNLHPGALMPPLT